MRETNRHADIQTSRDRQREGGGERQRQIYRHRHRQRQTERGNKGKVTDGKAKIYH